MKIININSAYNSDGKSTIARLLSTDFKSMSKKVLILDNSPEYISGLKRMYDLNNITGIDEIRPFIKGTILEFEQLNEVIIPLDSNDIHYIGNSEIDDMEETDLIYLLEIVENKYDIVIIESTNIIKSDKFDIKNLYITRPCEKILGKINEIKKDYEIVVVNKFEEDLGMNLKKLGVLSLSYDKEIILMENGYTYNLSINTKEELQNITDEIYGFKISETLGFDSNAKKTSFLSKIFSKK